MRARRLHTARVVAVLELAVALLLLLTASVPAQTDPANPVSDEPPQYFPMLVQHVTFAGNLTIPKVEQDRFGRELEGKTYNSEVAITPRVVAFWHEFGYWRAHVELEPKVSLVNGQRVGDLVFKIEEGDQYRLAEIRESGEVAFSSAVLYEMFLMKPGDLFDATKVQRGTVLLRGAYVDRGYSHAVVIPQVQFDQAAHTIALQLEVQDGPKDSTDVSTVECKNVLGTLPKADTSGFMPGTTYDPHRDALSDAQNATLEAARTGKNVLLEVGGDWCIWCHVLDRTFQQYPDIARLRDASFVTVFVNDDGQNLNEPLLSRLPSMPDAPHFFVLDAKGKLLVSQTPAEFEESRGYSPARIEDFLRKWSPDNSSKKCSETTAPRKSAKH